MILGEDGRPLRTDGYVNMLSKYGTSRDSGTAYRYQSNGAIADEVLTEHYENDGLFVKIIDAPAEEAVKHGFELDSETVEAEDVLTGVLDALDWEQKAMTAIKWARLYGGSIIVMLINDGGSLDEPLNRKRIRSIDEIRVYERAVCNPDWAASLYGEPQYYTVSSYGGYFKVHASRCLVFKNGILPENIISAQYRFWGLPEYMRIRNELRECALANGLSVKLLERCVQAIYGMKDLSMMLSTEDGENSVLRRLRLIDMARGILNTIAIDGENETYDFKTMSFNGIKDVLESTRSMLSAVTGIPQTVLFGRSPAGMNATGESDLENYYNLIERIQKVMLRGNLNTLSDIIFRAAVVHGDLSERPKFKLKFKPLWSLDEKDRAAVDQSLAATSMTKAQTAQLYVDMGALDPSEVRRGLAERGEFEIEKLLDDLPESDLEQALAAEEAALPALAPASQTGSPDPTAKPPIANTDAKDTAASVGVLVLNHTGELVLCGKRTDNGLIGGPGGNIQEGEVPAAAAMRETEEEFGIAPLNLKRLGQITGFEGGKYGEPYIYVCTEYAGEPKASAEMRNPCFFPIDEFEPESVELFPPFAESLKFLGKISRKPLTNDSESGIVNNINTIQTDGGEGSGRYPKGSGRHGDTGKITTPSKTITEVYQEGVGRVQVVPNTSITNKAIIAGNGKKPVKQEERLLKDYGGSKGKWTKKTQDLTVDVGGKQKTAEVHSFYEPTLGHVEQKVKRYRNGGNGNEG